jgi:hypothetical protein
MRILWHKLSFYCKKLITVVDSFIVHYCTKREFDLVGHIYGYF